MPTFNVRDPKTGREVTLTSQDNTPPTEQELEQIFSSSGQQQTQSTEGNQLLSEDPIQEQQSPISLKERLFLGAVNDRDREKYLRSKYSNVQRLPDGKFAVGNDNRNLQPIDPQGLFNDVLGDLADVASEIPVIAGQIMGATAGATLGNVPGAIAGSGIGAGVGELGKIAIGKMSGIDERTAEEMATDVVISSAFGAAGESLAIGTKAFGKKVLAPKLSSMMQKLSQNQAHAGSITPNNTPFANATKRVFHYLSGVKEESTDTFFKYGFKEMSNPEHFDKSNVLKIVDDTVKALDDTTKAYGKEVGKQTNALIGLSKNQYIDTGDAFLKARDMARDLGVLDDLYRIRKDHPTSAEIKPVISLLKDLGGEFKGGVISNTGKQKITIAKAIQMSREYGDKFDGVSPKVQHIFHDVLTGNDDIQLKGLRTAISDAAKSLGLKEYAIANEKFASLMGLRERLASLDTRNPGKIESFINRLENVGLVHQRDLKTLDNMIGGDLLRRWELFNAAQDFSKANLNWLRLGSIATTLGVLTGFDTKESRVGSLAGAAILGTPAGLRTLIRLSNRIGKPMSQQALKNIGSKIGNVNKSNVSSALLSRLLEQKFNNNAKNNKKQKE